MVSSLIIVLIEQAKPGSEDEQSGGTDDTPEPPRPLQPVASHDKHHHQAVHAECHVAAIGLLSKALKTHAFASPRTILYQAPWGIIASTGACAPAQAAHAAVLKLHFAPGDGA